MMSALLGAGVTEMTARYMQTPIGPIPIREHVVKKHSTMTDREVADEAFKTQPGFINPEAFAELTSRGLGYRGLFEDDIYELIKQREEAST